jgi:hypothetical protein
MEEDLHRAAQVARRAKGGTAHLQWESTPTQDRNRSRGTTPDLKMAFLDLRLFMATATWPTDLVISPKGRTASRMLREVVLRCLPSR